MIPLQFPPAQFKIQKRGEVPYIFDSIRKRWLQLTEEEWVRQNMVAYFIICLSYPQVAIALEKEIIVNTLKKRFDILVYNHDHQPWMLVECKAAHVNLSEDVLQQALRYNVSVPAEYIVLTNGGQTLAWKKTGADLVLLHAFPEWAK